MTIYRVTNLLNTSLSIEDLGIILAAGGSTNISADAHARSEDLRRLQRYVRVDPIYICTSATPRRADPIFPPPSSIPSPVPPPSNDISALNAKIDSLVSMVQRLTGAVENIPAPAVVPFRPGMEHAHEISVRGSDPMFIPSSIVPDGTEAHIKPHESEVSKDVSQARDALKKVRGKR